MLMLTGYFDESGTHDDSKAVTLAGYVARVSDWEAFEPEWNALLGHFRIPYSHMSTFAHKKCPFAEKQGWDEPKRQAFLQEAHSIIKKHTKKSFDVSLWREDYDAEIVNYKGNYKTPSPYVLLVNALMLNVGEWARSDPATMVPIQYIFERYLEEEGAITRTYEKALKDIRSGKLCLGNPPIFAEGKIWRNKLPPMVQLQAADMNAYEVNKFRDDQKSGRLAKVGAVRKSLDSLRGDDQEINMLHRDILRGMIENLNEEAILEREKENRN